jgi:arylsulfatase A-like enzyme
MRTLRLVGSHPMKLFRALILLSSFVLPHSSFSAQPNLIWIMADDLGYADLGCYGQKVITTPNLDRMAKEGMRFTHFYAGATVCAPSRSVLMTGLHHGHTRMSWQCGPENPAAQALKEGDVTVASVLKKAGYKTALIGKWGLGNVGAAESGLPRKHGFDYFYGYLSQHHAHNHFPDYLWRNESKEPLSNIIVPVGEDGAGYATEAIHYADDLFADDALKFVSENKASPFFLYWSMVIPHANNERGRILGDGAHVPDYGPYADKDWPKQDKGQAAMITRLDSYVGRMMEHLKTLGLAENTLVIFTSDNGPHNESKHDLERFDPERPLHRHQAQPHRWRHPRAIHRLVAGQGEAGRVRACRLFPRLHAHRRRTRRSTLRRRKRTASASCPCSLEKPTRKEARVPLLGIPRRRLQAGRALSRPLERHPQRRPGRSRAAL